MRTQKSRIVVFALALSAILMASSQVDAFCDVAGGRVIHAESSPLDSVTATTTIFWIAPNIPTPTFYYRFVTSNQTFINHLNTAHASNLQVRVRGNAAACGAAGVVRDGGTISTVYRDSFS